MKVTFSMATMISFIVFMVGFIFFAHGKKAKTQITRSHGWGQGHAMKKEEVRVQRVWHDGFFDFYDWVAREYIEANFGQIHDPFVRSQTKIYDIGVTPIFRVERKYSYFNMVRPYAEVAVGVHMMTSKNIGGRNTSSYFQFGDHFGMGLVLGKDGDYEIGYRLKHFSNGGFWLPNEGANFQYLHFGTTF